MRVGVLCRFDLSDIGGIGVVHQGVTEALTEADVEFIMGSPGDQAKQQKVGLNSHAFSTPDLRAAKYIYELGLRNGDFDPYFINDLLDRCSIPVATTFKEWSIDVLLGYTALDWSLGWRVAQRLGIPFTAVLHGGLAAETKLIYEATLSQRGLGLLQMAHHMMKDFFWPRRYTRLIAVSHFVKSMYVDWGVPAEDITVVSNGISLEKFQRSSTSDRSSQQLGPVVLVPARPAPRKCVASTMAMVGHLAKEFPDIQLVICPLDRLAGIDREIANLYGVADRIKCIRVQPDEMPAVYHSADLVMLPSYDEPFGLPVIEAMASGVPVLTTRDGAFPEIMEHEKSGLMFEPGSIADMVAQARRTLVDNALRQSLIAGGLMRAKKFTNRLMATGYLEILNDMVPLAAVKGTD